MTKRKAKPRPLTTVERETRRRRSAVASNDRKIESIRETANAEIGLLERKNKTHKEILAALK